jgi:hypothetical protein
MLRESLIVDKRGRSFRRKLLKLFLNITMTKKSGSKREKNTARICAGDWLISLPRIFRSTYQNLTSMNFSSLEHLPSRMKKDGQMTKPVAIQNRRGICAAHADHAQLSPHRFGRSTSSKAYCWCPNKKTRPKEPILQVCIDSSRENSSSSHKVRTRARENRLFLMLLDGRQMTDLNEK